VIEGDVERGSLMAGQSVGFVTREQSTHDILDELVSEAVAALGARTQMARAHAAREGVALAEPPPLSEAAK
jgi:enoyl-[acyl-carrier protein] reductase II